MRLAERQHQSDAPMPQFDEMSDGALDGGFEIRIDPGTAIVKALALVGRAVGVGRPYAYGLALDGVDGIVHVLRCLLAEADLSMAVEGYPALADLEASMRV